mgnify:CR=1 FL=1
MRGTLLQQPPCYGEPESALYLQRQLLPPLMMDTAPGRECY